MPQAFTSTSHRRCSIIALGRTPPVLSLAGRQPLAFQVDFDEGRPQIRIRHDAMATGFRPRECMEGTLPAGRLKCREVLLAVGQRIERIAVTVEPDRIARVACAALKERLVHGARAGASGAQPATDEVDDPSGARSSQGRVSAIGAARREQPPSGSNEVRGTVCAFGSPVLECSAWESCSALDQLYNQKLPRAREMA